MSRPASRRTAKEQPPAAMLEAVEHSADAASAAAVPRDPSPGEFGRRIKMLRLSRGLTLKDLEERGGISGAPASESERSKACPPRGAAGRTAPGDAVSPATLRR